MADNDKPKEPGSITQEADNKDERISEISNVNRTISNMQRNIDTRLQQIDEEAGDMESISEVHNSLKKVLMAMSGTVGDIGNGFAKIAKTTAETTTDSIKQYSRAISEDISYNKQNIVAMALSRSTPIFGYFAAKFMETDVFKSAAERMKANIGEALSGIGGKFKSIFKGKSKGEKESAIPKMQKGGYVEKGGMAQLHPAEVVMPIEKLLERIDESISVAQELADISKRAQLNTMAKMSTFIEDQKQASKKGLIQGFISAYAKVQTRYREPAEKRMLRAVLSIQDTLGATVGTWPQVWQKMLVEHPFFRNMVFTFNQLYKAIAIPAKLTYALFKGRGGYEGHLSKDKSPMAATAYNIGLVYTGGMWRLDNIARFTRATAEATRDMSSAITGRSYPALEGVPKSGWSIIGTLRKFTTQLIAKPFEKLAAKSNKKLVQLLAKDLFPEYGLSGEERRVYGKKAGLELKGRGGSELQAVELPEIVQKTKKYEALPVYVINKKLLQSAEATVEGESMRKKASRWIRRWRKNLLEQTEAQTGMTRRMLFFQRLKSMFGFAGGLLKNVFGLLTGGAGGILRLLTGGGGLLGGLLGGAKGLGKGLLGAVGYGGISGGIIGGLQKAVPKITTIFKGILTNPLVWKGGALAFAGFIGWKIGKLIDKLLGISEKFESLQNKWDKASKEVGDVVTKATNAAAQAAREGGAKGFTGAQTTKIAAGVGRFSQERLADVGWTGRRHIAGIEDAQRKFMMENINEYLKYSPEEINRIRQKWLSEGGYIGKTWGRDHIKYGQMREKAFLAYLQREGTKLTDREMREMEVDYRKAFAKKYPGKAAMVEGEEFARRKGGEIISAVKEGTGKVLEKAIGAYTRTTELAAQETKKLAANTKELRETMVNMGEKAATATREAGKELQQGFAQATNVISSNVSQNVQRITNVGGSARQEFDIFTEAVIRGNVMEDAY
jgi:hypothetical protein